MARHKFVVIALAAVALCSTFWFLLDVVGAVSHRQIFGVAAFESRFAGVRRTIPPHSIVGYVSDNDPRQPSERAEYFLTQYTLAPAIVKDSDDAALVIGNFHSKTPDAKLLNQHKLLVLQNFGNGVMLLRKRGR